LVKNASISPNHALGEALMILIGTAALLSCSGPKTLKKDDVQSELKAAISLAAETQMFIDYIGRTRVSKHYIEGEAGYLRETGKDSVKELENGFPGPGMEAAVRECKSQLALLDRELSQISAEAGKNNELSEASQRVSKIRENLQKAESTL
jgi:hypothetical protein